MTVTEIRPVTKQKYQIEVEGHSPFVLYKGEVFRYHIEKDREISPEIYREIIEEVLTKRAMFRALHLLEQGDRTKKDLEEKLLKNGYPPEAAEAALAYVESFHYIDDKRYALSYIQNQSGRKGRARIQMELRRKGVPQEYIDQAFQEMEEETYDVISVMINHRRLEIYKEGNRVKGGKVNMCKALNEMMEDSRRDGLQAGRRDGIRIGEKRGERNGEQKFAALAGRLMADSRTKDLEKAVNNETFRRKLYREYGMK